MNQSLGPSFDTIMELAKDMEEPLCEELVATVAPTGMFNEFIFHPLIHCPRLNNGYHNAHFRQKTQQLEQAEKDGDWHRYIALHEKPYRFDALDYAISQGLKDREYWKCFRSVWTMIENNSQNLAGWMDLWELFPEHRPEVMDKDEWAALEALPAVFRVWRGVGHRDAVRGLSWTTDKRKAEWFAVRYSSLGNTPYLASGTVKREDVLAHFDGSEKEVVIFPEHVIDMKVKKLPRDLKVPF